jgi:HlyD family secretion protein
MKKLILTLIVLAAIGGGTYAYYKNKSVPEPKVSTAELTRGDVVEAVQATGTLQAVKTVNVGTQVSGVVQNLYADFNDIVKKGQVIARLDPSLINVAIEQREASVTRANADLERLRVSLTDAERKFEQAKQMWDKQLIPRDQLETADLNVKTMKSQIKSSEAGLIQAQADLNTQKVNLGHTVITAPIDGVVIQRSVDEGQTVQASMNAPTLYLIAEDLSKMQVLANIDEAEIGKVRTGQPVTFDVDAYPGEVFTGTVSQIRLQPATVQNVVSYSTVIDVPNPNFKLKPGMTATTVIEVARRNDVLRAPAAALRFRPTNDMFAALKQEVPPEMQRAAGGRGGRGGQGRGEGRAGQGQTGQAAGAQGSQPPAAPQAAPPEGSPAQRQQPQQQGPERQATAQGGGDRSGDRPAGDGRSGRGNMTPEEREARRKQMEERMKNMSPEERERWEARRREGGGGGRGFGPGTQPAQGGGRGGVQGQQSGRRSGQPAPAPTMNSTNKATIDELFAPLPPTENRGRLWLHVNKQLKSVAVRTGITDGTWTEIIRVEGSDAAELETGTEVVTNVITGLEPQPRPGQQGQGGNPLMPQGGRGGPGGGGGPGGRGR